MPVLWIHRIQCREQSENTGSDNIYLTIEGNKVWPEGEKYVDIQEGKAVNVGYHTAFSEDVTVELREYDDHSRDDLLGSVTVNKLALGHGVGQANGDGGAYDIHYEVRTK